jgi:hypothetical protein
MTEFVKVAASDHQPNTASDPGNHHTLLETAQRKPFARKSPNGLSDATLADQLLDIP